MCGESHPQAGSKYTTYRMGNFNFMMVAGDIGASGTKEGLLDGVGGPDRFPRLGLSLSSC